MPGHLYLAPGGANDTVAIDDEGGAFDAHIFPPVHAFLYPDTIVLAERAVLVRDELHAKIVLGDKLVVIAHRILGRADDADTCGLERTDMLGKGDRLLGAARSVVLRIEVEHQCLTLEIGQRDVLAAGCRQGKFRRLVAHRNLVTHRISS